MNTVKGKSNDLNNSKTCLMFSSNDWLTFHRVQHTYSGLYCNAVFCVTISMNRFKFLLARLRFDDKATREEPCKQDRFAAKREIFQIFIQVVR